MDFPWVPTKGDHRWSRIVTVLSTFWPETPGVLALWSAQLRKAKMREKIIFKGEQRVQLGTNVEVLGRDGGMLT